MRQNTVNEQGNEGGLITVGLPYSSTEADVTRRGLFAMRRKHGKDSRIGLHCTQLISQLGNLPEIQSEDQRKALTASIQHTTMRLEKATAAARQGE